MTAPFFNSYSLLLFFETAKNVRKSLNSLRYCGEDDACNKSLLQLVGYCVVLEENGLYTPMNVQPYLCSCKETIPV